MGEGNNDIVTCIRIARRRPGKQTSLTIEAMFSAWSVQSRYKEEFRSWQ
jgi:hypothetical protein